MTSRRPFPGAGTPTRRRAGRGATACAVGAIVLSIGCAGPSRHGGGHEHHIVKEQDVKADVIAFIHQYIKTLEAGHEAAIRGLFVADDRFTWCTDGALVYESADDVLDGMRRFGGMRATTSVTGIRVVVLGNSLATAVTEFRTELTIPGADSIAYGGVITCCGLVASPKLETTVLPFILRGVSLVGCDSGNTPMPLRQAIWQKLATEWKVDALAQIATECTLAELDPEIDRILAGGQTGRVVVNLKE